MGGSYGKLLRRQLHSDGRLWRRGEPACPSSSPATTFGVLAPFSSGASVGMQINGTVQTNCTSAATPSDNFTITNNSIVGTSAAQLVASGTGIFQCYLGSPGSATTTPHNGIVVNFDASQNYLDSPADLYLSDTNTINPSVSSNYCAGTISSFAGCATSGFTTLPTCSFTLGNLYESGSTYYVPFTATNFTAQYGAVEWLASTSSTTPTSGDSRWSYVPPVYLSGVAHGNTVYLWVMDSAQNISAPASALIP